MPRFILRAIGALLLVLPLAAGQAMRVHAIDVGQGSATLLEFPNALILVDTGGENSDQFDSKDALEVYLADVFSRRTDLGGRLTSLVLTHPHIDHTRGVRQIRDSYQPRNVVLTGLSTGSGGAQFRMIQQYAEANEGSVGYRAVRLQDIPAGGLTDAIIDPVTSPGAGGTDPVLRVLWGAVPSGNGWNQDDFTEENNHSVVLRVDYGDSSVLITGDLEERGIEGLLDRYAGTSLLDTDVYVVGHHGSANATTDPFLVALSPELAVISMGPFDRQDSWTAWAYGHPRGSTISALEMRVSGARLPTTVRVGTGVERFEARQLTHAVYATGWDGTVVLDALASGAITVVSPGGQVALVNLNTASVDALAGLPRIGTTKAQAIVDWRATHGSFASVDALDAVPGIGPATVEAVRALVTF